MIDAEIIGHCVRQNRKNANLSQIELARLAGIGKTAVFDIEKGKETVKLKTLLAVLKALNIQLTLKSPIDHLPGENETEKKSSGTTL